VHVAEQKLHVAEIKLPLSASGLLTKHMEMNIPTCWRIDVHLMLCVRPDKNNISWLTAI
jgi:hypothetical protein